MKTLKTKTLKRLSQLSSNQQTFFVGRWVLSVMFNEFFCVCFFFKCWVMKEVTVILLTMWEGKLMALLSLTTCSTSFGAVGGLVTSRRAHSYPAFTRYFLLNSCPWERLKMNAVRALSVTGWSSRECQCEHIYSWEWTFFFLSPWTLIDWLIMNI